MADETYTTNDVERAAVELDRYVRLPADKRDWSVAMRDAYEHHAVHDFIEAHAAARRVYVREAARAVLVAVGPSIAARAWDECPDATSEVIVDTWDSLPKNPYREQEAR